MNQEQTNITTGKQIRHLRTQLGMTQEELAGELNVTRQALSNWERDVNEPDLNIVNLFRIVKYHPNAFKEEYKYLLGSREQSETIKEFEEKIQENTPEKAKKLKELTGIDTLTASIFCTEIVMSDLLKFLILSVTFFQTKCQFIKKTSPQRGCLFWRPGSESNRHTRICSPLHNHSATRPRATILGKK